MPKTLPSLLRAYEVSARAAAVGFDWAKAGDVLDKIEEEVAELRQEVESGATGDLSRAEEEMGDLLFAIANLSRKLGIEPEAALRRANDKFTSRFDAVEQAFAARNQSMSDATLEEMEAEWQRVKGFFVAAFTDLDYEPRRHTKVTKRNIDLKVFLRALRALRGPPTSCASWFKRSCDNAAHVIRSRRPSHRAGRADVHHTAHHVAVARCTVGAQAGARGGAQAGAQAPPAQPTRTVQDGVFSDAQATRGQALYAQRCAGCHGPALAGASAPALTGDPFTNKFRMEPLSALFIQIRYAMPPVPVAPTPAAAAPRARRRPGGVTSQVPPASPS